MENNHPVLLCHKTADEMDGATNDEGIAETAERTPSEGVDECGMYGVTRCSPTVDVSLERLGIIPREDSAHPSYTTYESRLESFSSWPVHVKLRPEVLCDAGFFYTGKGYNMCPCVLIPTSKSVICSPSLPLAFLPFQNSSCTHMILVYLIRKIGQDNMLPVWGRT